MPPNCASDPRHSRRPPALVLALLTLTLVWETASANSNVFFAQTAQLHRFLVSSNAVTLRSNLYGFNSTQLYTLTGWLRFAGVASSISNVLNLKNWDNHNDFLNYQVDPNFPACKFTQQELMKDLSLLNQPLVAKNPNCFASNFFNANNTKDLLFINHDFMADSTGKNERFSLKFLFQGGLRNGKPMMRMKSIDSLPYQPGAWVFFAVSLDYSAGVGSIFVRVFTGLEFVKKTKDFVFDFKDFQLLPRSLIHLASISNNDYFQSNSGFIGNIGYIEIGLFFSNRLSLLWLGMANPPQPNLTGLNSLLLFAGSSPDAILDSITKSQYAVVGRGSLQYMEPLGRQGLVLPANSSLPFTDFSRPANRTYPSGLTFWFEFVITGEQPDEIVLLSKGTKSASGHLSITLVKNPNGKYALKLLLEQGGSQITWMSNPIYETQNIYRVAIGLVYDFADGLNLVYWDSNGISETKTLTVGFSFDFSIDQTQHRLILGGTHGDFTGTTTFYRFAVLNQLGLLLIDALENPQKVDPLVIFKKSPSLQLENSCLFEPSHYFTHTKCIVCKKKFFQSMTGECLSECEAGYAPFDTRMCLPCKDVTCKNAAFDAKSIIESSKNQAKDSGNFNTVESILRMKNSNPSQSDPSGNSDPASPSASPNNPGGPTNPTDPSNPASPAGSDPTVAPPTVPPSNTPSVPGQPPTTPNSFDEISKQIFSGNFSAANPAISQGIAATNSKTPPTPASPPTPMMGQSPQMFPPGSQPSTNTFAKPSPSPFSPNQPNLPNPNGNGNLDGVIPDDTPSLSPTDSPLSSYQDSGVPSDSPMSPQKGTEYWDYNPNRPWAAQPDISDISARPRGSPPSPRPPPLDPSNTPWKSPYDSNFPVDWRFWEDKKNKTQSPGQPAKRNHTVLPFTGPGFSWTVLKINETFYRLTPSQPILTADSDPYQLFNVILPGLPAGANYTLKPDVDTQSIELYLHLTNGTINDQPLRVDPRPINNQTVSIMTYPSDYVYPNGTYSQIVYQVCNLPVDRRDTMRNLAIAVLVFFLLILVVLLTLTVCCYNSVMVLGELWKSFLHNWIRLQFVAFLSLLGVHLPCCLREFLDVLYLICVRWDHAFSGVINRVYSGNPAYTVPYAQNPPPPNFVYNGASAFFLHNVMVAFIVHLAILLLYIVVKIWDLSFRSKSRGVYSFYVFVEWTLLIVGLGLVNMHIWVFAGLNLRLAIFSHTYFTVSFIIAVAYLSVFGLAWLYFAFRLFGPSSYFFSDVTFSNFYYFFVGTKMRTKDRVWDWAFWLVYLAIGLTIGLLTTHPIIQLIIILCLLVFLFFLTLGLSPFRSTCFLIFELLTQLVLIVVLAILLMLAVYDRSGCFTCADREWSLCNALVALLFVFLMLLALGTILNSLFWRCCYSPAVGKDLEYRFFQPSGAVLEQLYVPAILRTETIQIAQPCPIHQEAVLPATIAPVNPQCPAHGVMMEQPAVTQLISPVSATNVTTTTTTIPVPQIHANGLEGPCPFHGTHVGGGGGIPPSGLDAGCAVHGQGFQNTIQTGQTVIRQDTSVTRVGNVVDAQTQANLGTPSALIKEEDQAIRGLGVQTETLTTRHDERTMTEFISDLKKERHETGGGINWQARTDTVTNAANVSHDLALIKLNQRAPLLNHDPEDEPLKQLRVLDALSAEKKTRNSQEFSEVMNQMLESEEED